MFKIENIVRKLQSNMLPAVLQKCSLVGGVLLFLFAFVFSLDAQSNLNDSNDLSTLTNQDTQNNPILLTEGADSSFYARYPYVIVIDEGDDIDITDEDFYRNAASVVFKVSKWDLPTEDKTLKELQESVLPQIRRDSLKIVRVKLRGAASPEGPETFNRFLSEHRQRALYDFVREYMQIPQADSLLLETATEDYNYLYKMMLQADDSDCEKVKQLFDKYIPSGQYARLKRALQTIDGGRLWRRILVTYFPPLRAARMIIVCQRKPEPKPIEPIEIVEPSEPEVPVDIPVTPEPEPWVERYARRELLSVKTNLLFYGVYMPGYNRWCPIPNIAVEYYPLRGHFTYGASFDCPWWQNYWGHKYFQVRNYQLETRYYFRRGDIELRPEGKGAAFKGFYLQAYAHATLFGICFDRNRGWVGEGGGAGLGLGYVMPLSKKGHWRMEFQLQAGFFFCVYDPYQFENLINLDYHDNLYYYRWTQKPGLFKKRQYRSTWIGPTRVGVTLSYDLFYRKARKKTDGIRCPKGTEPTEHYNPLVPYEKERKGGQK